MKVKLTNGYKGFVVEFLDRKNISKNALRIAKIVVIDEILGEGTDLATMCDVNNMWLERCGEDAIPQKLIVNDKVVEESDLEHVKKMVDEIDTSYALALRDFKNNNDHGQYGKRLNKMVDVDVAVNDFYPMIICWVFDTEENDYNILDRFRKEFKGMEEFKKAKEEVVKFILKGGYYER